MGVIRHLKSVLEKNKLGELMVLKGVISPDQLGRALSQQKSSATTLGQILVSENLITRRQLRRTLVQQWALRSTAAAIGVFIAFSSVGIKQARAGSVKDIPGQLQLRNDANAAFQPATYHQSIYGMQEKFSNDIKPFTKWTKMFKNFESSLRKDKDRKVISQWREDINNFSGLPLEEMAKNVNTYVNQYDYIVDKKNWGQSDYWATPVEFFQRGGDCEDFAIAKYSSLRALGVPENRLRIAIVQDLQKGIPHAVLIVYTDTGALLLDNQSKKVQRITSSVNRYKPIFTINQDGWWLHEAPKKTILASAR